MNHPNSGTPEQLAQVMQDILMNPSDVINQIGLVSEGDDNEIIVQAMLQSFNEMQSSPLMRQMSLTLNDLFDAYNLALTYMGFMMHHREIDRSELPKYVYYARLTTDGQLLRNQYHPIRLREIIVNNMGVDVPDTFEKLFMDRDYLPNITCVWDRGHDQKLILLNFQKVNLHFGSGSGPSVPSEAFESQQARGTSIEDVIQALLDLARNP